jgi:hypothetical protein
MQAFQEVGSPDVYPASTCARVVAGGGCATPMPMSESAPAIDPADACQQAIEAGLVVQRAHPLNCETPIPALIGGAAVPNAHFYVRNHFQIPNLDPSVFRLEVGGLVERELSLSPDFSSDGGRGAGPGFCRPGGLNRILGVAERPRVAGRGAGFH